MKFGYACIIFCGFIAWSAGKIVDDDFYRGIEKFQEFYDLPNLPYSYDALEPYIDAKTMEAHHGSIFTEYTVQMNTILRAWRASKKVEKLSKTSLINIVKNIEEVPEEWKIDLLNSAGGYLTHLFYFATLSPNPKGTERPIPPSFERIFLNSFPNITHFFNTIEKNAVKQFGVGHVWLCRVPSKNYLTVYNSIDEWTPLTYDFQPVLILDLWEHAYFVKHQSNRSSYIANWWKVVDWAKVERIFNWWKSFDPKHDEL